MPRPQRIALAGYPHHIVQRGHRQGAVFFNEYDRMDYLNTLQECRQLYSLNVYAYCLMTNHIHLIVAPRDDPRSLSALMKRLAGRHARRLNRMHGWRGALWESRFKCSPIDTDRYLLACGRYVDLNPVRAKLVTRADEFPWSSYRARAGFTTCEWLDQDPAHAALATSTEKRFERYREFANLVPNEEELEFLRGSLQRNQLTGPTEFIERVARERGLQVPSRKRGRPRTKEAPEEDRLPSAETKQAPFGA